MKVIPVHDGGHSFCECECGWAPVRRFLCLFWREKPTQRACTQDFRRDRTKTSKGKVLEQNREKLASHRKATVRERRLLKEELEQPTKEDESAFLVAVWQFCSSTRSWWPQTHRVPEECPNFSLFAHRANTSPCLFVLSSPLGYICYVCCIFVKHVKWPWPEMRESIWLSNGHELI